MGTNQFDEPSYLKHDPYPLDDATVAARFSLRVKGRDYPQLVLAPHCPGCVKSRLSPAEAVEARTIAGLTDLEANFGRSGAAPREVTPSCSEVEAVSRFKRCRYRTSPIGSARCTAPHLDDSSDEVVDEQACFACDVPDERWACSHLRGAIVATQELPDGTRTRESMVLDCALGLAATECVPGGAGCWTRAWR